MHICICMYTHTHTHTHTHKHIYIHTYIYIDRAHLHAHINDEFKHGNSLLCPHFVYEAECLFNCDEDCHANAEEDGIAKRSQSVVFHALKMRHPVVHLDGAAKVTRDGDERYNAMLRHEGDHDDRHGTRHRIDEILRVECLPVSNQHFSLDYALQKFPVDRWHCIFEGWKSPEKKGCVCCITSLCGTRHQPRR